MYVKIERCSCVSCGACWNTCPEIFDQNPCDEYSELVEAYRFCGSRAEGEVPEELAACARWRLSRLGKRRNGSRCNTRSNSIKCWYIMSNEGSPLQGLGTARRGNEFFGI
jgi:ferredoxin